MGLLLFLPLHEAFASDCSKLEGKIRQAHEWFFGIDFPYWYSLAQVKVESNCIWRTSLDGWSSIGYAQITPKFWEKELKDFPNWKIKDQADHFFAQAYILQKYHSQNPCNKLYITYQCYNRSLKKVLKENKDCEWDKGFIICMQNPQNICVWKKNGKCLQFRTDCDINYNYSRKIFDEGRKLERWKTRRWIFW